MYNKPDGNKSDLPQLHGRRVQLPVLTWDQANYSVDFVDVITEAGMTAPGQAGRHFRGPAQHQGFRRDQ